LWGIAKDSSLLPQPIILSFFKRVKTGVYWGLHKVAVNGAALTDASPG